MLVWFHCIFGGINVLVINLYRVAHLFGFVLVLAILLKWLFPISSAVSVETCSSAWQCDPRKHGRFCWGSGSQCASISGQTFSPIEAWDGRSIATCPNYSLAAIILRYSVFLMGKLRQPLILPLSIFSLSVESLSHCTSTQVWGLLNSCGPRSTPPVFVFTNSEGL